MLKIDMLKRRSFYCCLFIHACLLAILQANVQDTPFERTKYKTLIDYYNTDTKAGFNGPFFILDNSFITVSNRMKRSLGVDRTQYTTNGNAIASNDLSSVELRKDVGPLGSDFSSAANPKQAAPDKRLTQYQNQYNYFQELEVQLRSPN